MKTSVLSTIALLCGVLGLCLSCILIGVFPSIIGLILGIIALNDELAYKWPSVCAICCSAIGIIVFIVVMTQSPDWNTPTVATPTQVVQNLTNTDKNEQQEVINNLEEVESSQTPTVTEQTTFKQGETAELNGVRVTMTSYKESNGGDYNKPSDGNIFIIVEFEIENNTDRELSVSSMLSFEAYADDYALNYSLSALMEKGNSNQLDGTIAAGKKMRGVIGYEIPVDWKNVEIHFTDNVWSNNKFKFEITK